MSVDSTIHHYHVYRTGRMTVIGFEGRHLDNPQSAGEIREQLLGMITHHECEVLVVDLLEVDVVSSWLLGVLAAIRQTGTDVELYHPSKEIQEILNLTKLDEYLHVRGASQ